MWAELGKGRQCIGVWDGLMCKWPSQLDPERTLDRRKGANHGFGGGNGSTWIGRYRSVCSVKSVVPLRSRVSLDWCGTTRATPGMPVALPGQRSPSEMKSGPITSANSPISLWEQGIARCQFALTSACPALGPPPAVGGLPAAHGLTLIEMLIAVALTLLVILAIVRVFDVLGTNVTQSPRHSRTVRRVAQCRQPAAGRPRSHHRSHTAPARSAIGTRVFGNH